MSEKRENKILPVTSPRGLTLLEKPDEKIAQFREVARALVDLCRQSKDYVVKINNREYLKFEAWQTIASFFGVFPRVVRLERINEGGKRGYLCEAEAVRYVDDKVIVLGRALAYCFDNERNWAGKPRFQIASMAQTRAMAKVLRSIFSNIAVMAGYEATPAEEVDGNHIIEAEVVEGKPQPQKNKFEWPTREQYAEFLELCQMKKISTLSEKQQDFVLYLQRQLEDGHTHLRSPSGKVISKSIFERVLQELRNLPDIVEDEEIGVEVEDEDEDDDSKLPF